MQIAPGIYQLKSPIDTRLNSINSYLIEGKAGWTMIDTGWSTEAAFEALQTGLKEIGLAVSDISKIILTHVHPDHFGLAGKIKQMSARSEVLVHRLESDLIESRYVKFTKLRDEMSAMLAWHGVPLPNIRDLDSASLPALNFITLTFPDTILFGGEILSTGIYNLEVIWTPGHSPGHICIYEPENKLLFTGDHILASITPNVGAHVQSGDNPLGDYICALKKLQNLQVNKVLPAHENTFEDLRGRILQIIEHHDRRRDEILNALKGGADNAWAVSSKVKWNVPESWEKMQPFVRRSAVMETVAHLDYMRWEGTVDKKIKDNCIFYRVK